MHVSHITGHPIVGGKGDPSPVDLLYVTSSPFPPLNSSAPFLGATLTEACGGVTHLLISCFLNRHVQPKLVIFFFYLGSLINEGSRAKQAWLSYPF